MSTAVASNSEFEFDGYGEDPRTPLVVNPRHGRPTPSLSTWDPRLVYDLAVAIDSTDTILERHRITEDTLKYLYSNQLFRSEILNLRKDLQEDGITLRTKAKLQAESYLIDLDQMIHDDEVPASTRLDAIKYVNKLGDTEPKKSEADNSGGNQFGIQIIMGGNEVNIGGRAK